MHGHTGAVCILFAASLSAQSIVTPTPDRPDEIRTPGKYLVSSSLETGYRFADVAGNRDAYRAAVNYGNGVRLFEGQVRIHSQDGRGKLLDELQFRTVGAATDPYQISTVRAEKNELYRYDMRMSLNRYWNQLPALWAGERGVQAERLWQNHDLTLFSGSPLEILLGYDRNSQSGPGFFTEGIPSRVGAFERENFLRYRTDLRRTNNTYRAGMSFKALGMAVTAIQSLDNYKEDTLFSNASDAIGVLDNVQLTTEASRHEPIHGNTPVTIVALRTEQERRINFQGRFAYSNGSRNTALREDVTAFNPGTNLTTLRQTFLIGDAGRTQTTAEGTITLLPSLRWTITNSTAVNSSRIRGGVSFLEVTAVQNQLLRFEDLDIRHATNATEASYRPIQPLSLHVAYRYSTRRIGARTAIERGSARFEQELVEVDNNVHAGAAGVRWMIRKGLRASLDIEAGRADQPLTPVSDRNFHNESARLQWRRDRWTMTGFLANRTNTNPQALTGYSSENRRAGFHATWADVDGRWTLDGGYAWMRLDTAAGVFNYFQAAEQDPSVARTFYTSNLHTANFGGRFVPHSRVTLYLGYALAKDTGDGRSGLNFDNRVNPTYPNFAVEGSSFFLSFPLTYQSPQARLTFQFNDRLQWIFGWQYYDYSERFTGVQNYRAHTGYSSFRWSF